MASSSSAAEEEVVVQAAAPPSPPPAHSSSSSSSSSRRVPRGAFIVIEGLDRSGKTTQVQRLEAELTRHGKGEVKLLRFPNRSTPIGHMINQYLQSRTQLEDHVIHLLFSANRWEQAGTIEADLARGCTLLCDRYTYSGMIYSAAKRNPRLGLSWAREPDVGLLRPDLVVFLDLSLEEAERRGGFGEEKYERREMQENVRSLFYRLRDADEEEAEDMVVIDAAGEVDEVGRRILDVVTQRLAVVEAGGLGEEVRRIGKWRLDR